MLMFQAYLAYSGIYLAYGLIAVLLCPVRTWSVIFALVMQFVAHKTQIPPYKSVKQIDRHQSKL